MTNRGVRSVLVATISAAAVTLAGFAGGVMIVASHVDPGAREHMAAQIGEGQHVSGSGFAVAPGYVVTNAHVTMSCRANHMPLTVAGAVGWRLVDENPSSELALLAGPQEGAPPPLKLSATPQLSHGTSVLLLGYPLGSDARSHLRIVPGSVQRAALTVHRPQAGASVSFSTTASNGQQLDPSWADGVAYFGARHASDLRWIVEIAASSGHGDSGGPVVDGGGNVVGVIFAGSLQTGQTSAVSLDDLRDFLLRADVMPRFAPPGPSVGADWQAVGDAAASSVVRVGC